MSGRRLSRVHFGDQLENTPQPDNDLSADQAPSASRDDPYNPRWQNAIYDSGQALGGDNHRPSAATLVADGDDLEPPLDHLDDFMKKSGATAFSKDVQTPGVLPPPSTYAPGRNPSVSSKKKKESRTVLERKRRASISTFQVRREETREETVERLEKERRRGLPANIRELYGLPDPKKMKKKEEEDDLQGAGPPIPRPPRPERATSEEFDTDILLDEKDPRFTGKIVLDAVLDRDEIELERLKKMTFAQRMSEKERDKIRFHIVCKLFPIPLDLEDLHRLTTLIQRLRTATYSS
jgi:hypothetical protein